MHTCLTAFVLRNSNNAVKDRSFGCSVFDTMTMTCTGVINQFVAENADVYPHSEVKATRKGHHCKWIILQARGRNTDIVSAGEGYLHSLPSACIDSGSLQQLILSKSALPMTSDMDDIYDCMSIWGRGISERWHQLVLNLLCDKEKRSRKEIFRLSILIRVNELIDYRLLHLPHLAYLVHLQWFTTCQDMYDYMSKDYFELCMRSFQHVQAKINESLSPAGVTPVAVSSEDESSVHCIPVVSSSSD